VLSERHKLIAGKIWEIANRLRGPYRPPQYRLVMLPMVVLRRLDCVLEPTKDAVRASYGTGLGEYYTAFFGLSVGIERLAKLILIADHAITNRGALPDQNVVRRFGHDLKRLCEKADKIAAKHGFSLTNPKPTDPICWAAIDCLDSFADAAKGRYANFEAIGNPAFDPAAEPVNKWWADVVEPILDRHYRGRAAERGVKQRAAMFETIMGGNSLVLHTDEGGGVMTSHIVASERTGQTKWAQQYGRFYTLGVVRWLAGIFSELIYEGAYRQRIEALLGHNELFGCYLADDNLLRTRKVWPTA
jgi:hypothetical protein